LLNASIGTEERCIQQTTHGVTRLNARASEQILGVVSQSTHFILTSTIQLTTKVTRLHIDKCLIYQSDNLKILTGAQYLNTGKSAGRDSTGAISVFCAPTNFFTLCVGDGRVGFGRGPDTEIWKEVSFL
jgi:hypothetical protein